MFGESYSGTSRDIENGNGSDSNEAQNQQNLIIGSDYVPPSDASDDADQYLKEALGDQNPYIDQAREYIEKNANLELNRGVIDNKEGHTVFSKGLDYLKENNLTQYIKKVDYEGPTAIMYPIIDTEKGTMRICQVSHLFCIQSDEFLLAENNQLPESISFSFGDANEKYERNLTTNTVEGKYLDSNEQSTNKKKEEDRIKKGFKYVLASIFGTGDPTSFSNENRKNIIDDNSDLSEPELESKISELRYDIENSDYSLDRKMEITYQVSVLEDYLLERSLELHNPHKEINKRAKVGDLIFFDKDETDFDFMGKLGENGLADTSTYKGRTHVGVITYVGTDGIRFSHSTTSGKEGHSGASEETLTEYDKKYAFDAMLVRTNINNNTRSKIPSTVESIQPSVHYDNLSAVTQIFTNHKIPNQAMNCAEYVAEVLGQVDPKFESQAREAIPNNLLESGDLFTPVYCTSFS